MTAADAQALATRHYFDREFSVATVKLLPGEFDVTSGGIVLTTVLGSCVSACLRDSISGVGGMNHFMPPDGVCLMPLDTAAATRYGAYAMQVLLGEMVRAGARCERLEAKVFGGRAMLLRVTLLNIGHRNADFVLRYLLAERIRISAQDLRRKLLRCINFPLSPPG